jgi:hypothetical protein
MKQKHGTETFTDDELIEAYNNLKTLGLIAVHFNVPQITIHRRSQKLGLEYKNGGQNKGKGQIKFNLQDILDGKHPQYPTLKLKNRLINENLIEKKCKICGIDQWMGKEITLQLDHINGINNDHRLENLQLLCPNCHSQTETYCGKNR